VSTKLLNSWKDFCAAIVSNSSTQIEIPALIFPHDHRQILVQTMCAPDFAIRAGTHLNSIRGIQKQMHLSAHLHSANLD
jgi:hypothetical protein